MSKLGKLLLAAAFCALIAAGSCWAIGEERFVEGEFHSGDFVLVRAGAAAEIYVDASDYPGVTRAANDLGQDIQRVTGIAPRVRHDGSELGATVVIIGTLGKSALIDRLIREHKIDATALQGKWESYLIQTVAQPIPGVSAALVIAGSDKRGTIYGIYEISEQIGVSPWYWWADVPIAHRDALFVKPGRHVQGEAAVKYRGIFLNDEAPALTGWVNEKFGGYKHEFYEKVFELLLRLRANFLWPAMWNSAFNEDDPLNPKLADEYGIVMGTSHHEPMLRAQQEWKRHGKGAWDYSTNGEELREFWSQGIERNKDYESIITLGMRGDGDMPMSEESNVALLEKIVADQRKILAREMNPDLEKIPQSWALYKEVQEYYEKGMRVPDDVTLLWCDDNWGNIRRLPTAEERKRERRRGDLLPLRLCGRAAVVQVDQYESASESLGADEPGVPVWRDADLDCERGRLEAHGIPDGIFSDVRKGSGAVAEGETGGIHCRMGDKGIRSHVCFRDREDHGGIREIQREEETGAFGAGDVQPGGL